MATLVAFCSGAFKGEPAGKMIRDSAVEFVATTLFVFSGTMSAVSTSSAKAGEDGGNVAQILPIAMSFGISILALAHSIGHLTGGHMNPGVSLMMLLKGQISIIKMLLYWVAQMAGAFCGSALVYVCTSGLVDSDALDAGVPPISNLGSTTLATDRLTVWNGFFFELIGSTVFYFVIAQTATDKRGIATTAFPALPIGLILVVVHVCLIPFTGCGVNPARTFGPSMFTCVISDKETCDAAMDPEWYWIYFVGPAAAAVLVAEVTAWMSIDFAEPEEPAAHIVQNVAPPAPAAKPYGRVEHNLTADDDSFEDASA